MKSKNRKIMFIVFCFVLAVISISLLGTSLANSDTTSPPSTSRLSGKYDADYYSTYGSMIAYEYGSDVMIGESAEKLIVGDGIKYTATKEENIIHVNNSIDEQMLKYGIRATKKQADSYVDYIGMAQRNTSEGIKSVDIRIYYWSESGENTGYIVYEDNRPGYPQLSMTYGSNLKDNPIIGMEMHFYEGGTLDPKNKNTNIENHELTGLYTYLYLSDMDRLEGYKIATDNKFTLYTSDTPEMDSRCPSIGSEHVEGCSTVTMDYLNNTSSPFYGFYLGAVDLAESEDNSIGIGVQIKENAPLTIYYTSRYGYAGTISSHSKKVSYHLFNYPYGYNTNNFKLKDRIFATYTNISESQTAGDGGASKESIDLLFGDKSYVSVAGYHFDGWYTSNKLTGNKYVGTNLITKDVDLYGSYSPAYNPPNPTKTQDTSKLHIDDKENNTVTYTITQNMPKVENTGNDMKFSLSAMSITDTLDSALEYLSAKLYYENKEITEEAGTIQYDTNTHKVIYSFSKEYLKAITNFTGQSYNLKITAKVKDGLTGISSIKNKSITNFNDGEYILESNEITTNIYYPVTVHYVDTNNKKLLDSKIIYVKTGEKYNAAPATIPNYDLAKTIGDAVSGTMGTKPIEVTHIYTLKKTKVIVNYIDESKNTLADSITIDGTVFDQYETKEKTFPGYNLISTPINATGTMTEETIIVNYIYTKKEAAVIIHYIDEDGKAIAESEALAGSYKDSYETKAKEIPGYQLTKIPENAKGTMTEDTIIVNYIYRLKDTKVIARYVDEAGKELLSSITIEGKVFAIYETQAQEIYGYLLTKVPENAKGTMKEETIEVNYIYRLKDTSVIVKYVDEAGKELISSDIIKGKVFDTYETQAKEIKGYTLTIMPENASGKMSENVITITYVYAKNNIENPNTADKSVFFYAIILVFLSMTLLFGYKKFKKIK